MMSRIQRHLSGGSAVLPAVQRARTNLNCVREPNRAARECEKAIRCIISPIRPDNNFNKPASTRSKMAGVQLLVEGIGSPSQLSSSVFCSVFSFYCSSLKQRRPRGPMCACCRRDICRWNRLGVPNRNVGAKRRMSSKIRGDRTPPKKVEYLQPVDLGLGYKARGYRLESDDWAVWRLLLSPTHKVLQPIDRTQQ